MCFLYPLLQFAFLCLFFDFLFCILLGTLYLGREEEAVREAESEEFPLATPRAPESCWNREAPLLRGMCIYGGRVVLPGNGKPFSGGERKFDLPGGSLKLSYPGTIAGHQKGASFGGLRLVLSCELR